MGSSCGKCCCEGCNHSVDTVGDEPDTDLSMVHEIVDTNADVTDPSNIQSCINDICGLKDSKFIIQAGAYFVEMKKKSLADDLPKPRPLQDQCKYGNHYLAQYIIHYPRDRVSPPLSSRKKKTFYVIKGNSCIVVENLGLEERERRVFDLHPDCQRGSHYLADRAGFYIIRSEDNTYLHVKDMSKDGYKSSCASRHELHESYTNGLYYFATDYYFYILKRDAEFGLVYHRTKGLGSNDSESWFPVSGSVVNFLQGPSQRNEAAATESTPSPSTPTTYRSMTVTTSTAGSYPLGDQRPLNVTQELSLAKPDSSNLRLIKWKDESGEMKEFRLKSLIVHKWRVIGDLVRVPRSKLEAWNRKKEAEECCDAVLSHWLDDPPRT